MKQRRSLLYFVLGIFAPVVLFESEVYREILGWRRRRELRRLRQSGWQPRIRRYDGSKTEFRPRIVSATLLGWILLDRVNCFKQTARTYKRHRDRKVSSVAKVLYRESDKALFLLDYFRAGLELRFQFERFWSRNDSDLREFWKSRFGPAYDSLEESTKKLGSLLLEPELCEAFDKILSAQRPRLELPECQEDEARDELRQLKGTLWQMLPANRVRLTDPLFKNIVGLKASEGTSAPHNPLITAYAESRLRELPEAEKDLEMKEVEELLDQLETNSGRAKSRNTLEA